jgi:tRNA uridine 5-carboxymethylaminomethyl modification enzyme
VIEGTGTRYCPSIEDKVVRFADKDKHQVFIEPEGLDTTEMYVSGMSTSLPEDVQIAMYRTVPGLENCRLTRNGYAIEYDCIDATQLTLSLEFKAVRGLFSAGQFNGSSGYEEAAAQGIVAGINAARHAQDQPPITIDRSEGYIGVLIDDLVTKGSQEPYRMMTSRAEYRLLLRQDNADLRLMTKGHEVGLVSNERYNRLLEKKENIAREIKRLEKTTCPPNQVLNDFLLERESTAVTTGVTLAELLKRPELSYDDLAAVDALRPFLPPDVCEQVHIQVKYDGYIKRQNMQIEQYKKLENRPLPSDYDYSTIHGLRLEARQKLNAIKPCSVGQASRITGVSPSDISVLLIHFKSK